MRIALTIAVIAFPAIAFAQIRPADIECKKTETQPECFARLKCKPDEELADCQKRLRAAAGSQGNQGQGNQGQGNQGGQRDSGQRDSGQRDSGQRDSGDSGRGRGERDSDSDSGDRGRRGGSRDDSGGSRGRSRRAAGDHRGFVANKKFGLGLELGEPTGLNGKLYLSDSGALDFGVGYIYDSYYFGDGFHIYADYLFHPAVVASTDAFELPFYIGPGLRYWDFNYCDVNRVCTFYGSAVGLRMPLGLDFDFNNVPLDIFVQIVPVLDFLSGDYYRYYGNREHFGIDFSAGIRFWFK